MLEDPAMPGLPNAGRAVGCSSPGPLDLYQSSRPSTADVRAPSSMRRGSAIGAIGVAMAVVCAQPRLAIAGAPLADDSASRTQDAVDKKHDDDDDDDDGSDFTLGAEADVNSRFIWRGLALSDNPVLQPSAWATVYGLNAVVWTNVMLTNEASNRLTDILPMVSYTFAWKNLTIEPGFVYYDITDPSSIQATTAEASLEASIEVARFRLRTTDYVDVMHTPGAYFGTFGGSWEPKTGRWSFKALAECGWATGSYNKVYFGAAVTTLDLAEVGASVQYDLTDILYLALHTEGSILLASSLAAGRESTLGSGGLTFGGQLGL
jgi:hypothetical protein